MIALAPAPPARGDAAVLTTAVPPSGAIDFALLLVSGEAGPSADAVAPPATPSPAASAAVAPTQQDGSAAIPMIDPTNTDPPSVESQAVALIAQISNAPAADMGAPVQAPKALAEDRTASPQVPACAPVQAPKALAENRTASPQVPAEADPVVMDDEPDLVAGRHEADDTGAGETSTPASVAPAAAMPAAAAIAFVTGIPAPPPPAAGSSPANPAASRNGTDSVAAVDTPPPALPGGTAAAPSRRTAADPVRRASGATAQAEPRSDAPPATSGADPRTFATAQAQALLDVTVDGPGRVAAASADMPIERHLDLAQDHAWLDRLAQDIALSAGGASRVRFALAPEHLGRMTVDIANSADGTAVRMTTETEQAQRIIADAQPRLVAEARAQGLRLTETSVDLDQRSGGQQHQQTGTGTQQGATAGFGGQSGDRPRGIPTPLISRRTAPRAITENKAVAGDLYA